jgi:hypothetical protein
MPSCSSTRRCSTASPSATESRRATPSRQVHLPRLLVFPPAHPHAIVTHNVSYNFTFIWFVSRRSRYVQVLDVPRTNPPPRSIVPPMGRVGRAFREARRAAALRAHQPDRRDRQGKHPPIFENGMSGSGGRRERLGASTPHRSRRYHDVGGGDKHKHTSWMHTPRRRTHAHTRSPTRG